jgi:hypothetical protein
VTMESMMMKKRSMMQLLQACSSSLAARQRTAARASGYGPTYSICIRCIQIEYGSM